jgi:hypothetical protein
MQHHEQPVGGFLGAAGMRLTVYLQICRTPYNTGVLADSFPFLYNKYMSYANKYLAVETTQ